MKKINSIDYGGKVIGIGLIFLVLVPVVLYAVNRFISSPVLHTIMCISMGIGGVIEVGFLCVLFVELRQDRRINRFYESNPSSDMTPQQILRLSCDYRKSATSRPSKMHLH